MITIEQSPAKIHTVYNPVVFMLGSENNENSILPISIVAGKTVIKLDVRFSRKALAHVDISEQLKSLFDKMNNALLISPSYVDGSLSVEYSLHENHVQLNSDGAVDPNEYPLLGTFTAVKAVSQQGEPQSLMHQRGRLLTGFDRLIVYNDSAYRRDVSALAWEGEWTVGFAYKEGMDIVLPAFKRIPAVANRVNRLPLECNDNGKTVTPPHYFNCTAKWGNWVCQTEPGGAPNFIPIYTAEDLIGISSIANPQGFPYVLMNDIDLGGVSNYISPNLAQGEILYGQGFAIKNLTLNASSEVYYYGVFGFVEGTIYDVIVSGARITADASHSGAGALAGFSTEKSKIINCKVQNSIIACPTENYAGIGGLIGSALGKHYYCSAVNVQVLGFFRTGGLFGSLSANVNDTGYAQDCVVSQSEVNSLSGSLYTGGIAGSLGLRNASMLRCVLVDTAINIQNGGSDGGGIAYGYHLNSNNIKMEACVVAKGCLLSTNQPNTVGRISSFSAKHIIQNCYADTAFNIGRTPVSNASGKDGGTVDTVTTEQQSFYEGLGFDFDGSSTSDGQAIWKIDNNGRPLIIKKNTLIDMPAGDTTGLALATTLNYTLYENYKPAAETIYNILNAFASYPAITRSQWQQYSTEQAKERADALLESIPKCSNFEVLNKPYFVSEDCGGIIECYGILGKPGKFAISDKNNTTIKTHKL